MSEATLMPQSDPIGLKDCAKLSLRVLVSLSPNDRIKGLAVVSRNAKPKVRIYSDRQKNGKLCSAAAGIKRKAPVA